MNQNPYAAPVSDTESTRPSGGIYRRGSQVVVDRKAQFPSVCIKTGAESTHFVNRKHSWHHPAIVLTVLLSPVIYILIALIVRKKAQFSVAVSPEAVSKRRIGIAVGSVVVAIGIGLFIYGMMNSAPGPNSHLAILMLVGAMVFMIGVLFGSKFGAYYGIKSIDDRFTIISGAHKSFLNQLPDYPTAAATYSN